MVRPHLEYSSVAWSPHYVKDKALLERVQHRFTRMFPELKDLPYSLRLAKLRLWSLEERRNRADLIEIFKMIKGFSAVLWTHFFTRSDSGVTRGHNWKLMKKGVRGDPRVHCFSHRSVNRWNSLTQQEVDASSVNLFKNNLGEASSLEDGLLYGLNWSPSPMAARDKEQNTSILRGSKMTRCSCTW